VSKRTKPRPTTFTIELPMTFTLKPRSMTFRPMAVTLGTAKRTKPRPMTFSLETVKRPEPRSPSKKARRSAP